MYIPESKLDPKIYKSNGNEYILSTTRLYYIGPYRKTKDGKAFTGEKIDQNSVQLYSVIVRDEQPKNNLSITSANSNEYYSISKNNPLVSIPKNDSYPPNLEDINKGYYTRYILKYKLSTQPIFTEVNPVTYSRITNSPQKQYFEYVEIPWKISGPLHDIRKGNMLVKGGVIDTNKRVIQNAEKTMKGISSYLTNLLLYYKQ